MDFNAFSATPTEDKDMDIDLEDDIGLSVEVEQSQTDNAASKGRKTVKKRRTGKAVYWVSYEVVEDEDGTRKANCKHCKKSYVCDSNRIGNKNLRNHFYACLENPANKGKGKQAQLIFQSTSGNDNDVKLKTWNFDENLIRASIVEMMIKDEMPFSSVEKEGLKNAFLAACPQFKMPSRTTIQRDCFNLYIKEREKMKELFDKSCQRVCITIDTWTSSNMVNYMFVTAHYIDNEWNLQKKVINFCKITSHKGQDVGRALEDCLNYWNLDGKLLTVTVDNASANDVLCGYMAELAKERGSVTEGKYLHIRCMTHILNLIVQDGIKQCGEYVDKLRAVIKYVRGSPARLNTFKQLVEKSKLNCSKSLRLDVCTRWNSTYDILTSAQPYRAILTRMKIPLLEDSNLGPLTPSDWSKIDVLATYLKEFYEITTRISGSSYVTSTYMVLYVSKVINVLTKLAANGDSTLQKMASDMKKKCDKYWGSIDTLNLLMFVPTILHPFYKIRGVSIALQMMFGSDSLDSMVVEVKKVAYELFDRYVNCYAVSENQGDALLDKPVTEGESSNWTQEFEESMARGNPAVDDISSRSEFDLYLRERHEAKDIDVLKWWRLNAPRYPILSRMARDVLVIPISTVPSESTFSTGGRHLTSYRSRLKPKMVQALICTQDWLRLQSLTKKDSNSDVDDDDGDEDECDEGTFYA